MRQGAKLDREAFQDPRVELILVGEDVGGLNNSVPLTVTILDQNDNPPVFSPSSFSVRLPENSPTGMLLPFWRCETSQRNMFSHVMFISSSCCLRTLQPH